ncbi:MAG TPA: hypothetical protein VKT77_04355 [Chthonomonadaceae bacterium]|nr:hypothetical protein [Chthonomonadaceae bacterium]
MGRGLRRLAFTACLLWLGLSGARAQSPAGWKPFANGPGRFSIRMPGTPVQDAEQATANPQEPVTHTFTLDLAKIVYTVSYTDYDPETIARSKRAAFLSAARDGGIKNVKGRLISESAITVDGYPGRDDVARFSLDGKPAIAHFRIVLANTRLYMALYIGPADPSRRPAVEAFLKSLKILPAPAGDGWQTFTSADGRFSVRVPARPTEDTADEGEIKIHRFSVDRGVTAYIVSYNQIPGGAPATPDVPGALQKVPEGVAAALKGKVIESKPLALVGSAGIAARIAIQDKRRTAYLRAYIAGDRLYQAIVLSDTTTIAAAKPDRFLESFKLVDTGPPVEWSDFSPDHGGFAVKMPGKPVLTKLPNGTTKYQSSEGGAYYIVVATELPDVETDPARIDLLLGSLRDAETKALSAKIVGEKRVAAGEVAGIQAVLSVPETQLAGGGLAFERFFVAGKRVYETTVITHDLTAEETAFAKFFNSFKITGR